MKYRLVFISLIILFTIKISIAKIIFEDEFTTYDSSRVSLISNIKYENDKICLSNINKDGRIITPIITRQTNERWNTLSFKIIATNSESAAGPGITIAILDKNNNVLTNIGNYKVSDSGIHIAELQITNRSIKISAYFKAGNTNINPGTLFLDYWKLETIVITGETVLYSDSFYGVPSPFKPAEGKMKFYYKPSENCVISIKIYDANYSVVKELTKQVDDLEKRFYYHRDRILKGLKQKEKKVKMRINLMRHKIKILKSKIKE